MSDCEAMLDMHALAAAAAAVPVVNPVLIPLPPIAAAAGPLCNISWRPAGSL